MKSIMFLKKYGARKIRNIVYLLGLNKYDFVQAVYRKIKPMIISHFCVTLEGNKMFLDVQDSLNISINGVYEEFETNCVKKIIQKGDTVLDIGANIGYYTLVFAKIVGDTGKIFAFEPEPNNFEVLKENVEINGYKNITLVPKAVSDTTDRIKFYLSNSNLGGHSIYNVNEKGKIIDVEVIKLDDYFKNFTSTINFIKMDVEGSELTVMRGMKEILQKMKNVIIMMEFSVNLIKKCGNDPKEYLEFLIQNNFKIYDIDAQAKKIIKRDISELLQKNTPTKRIDTNLLCVKGKEPEGIFS